MAAKKKDESKIEDNLTLEQRFLKIEETIGMLQKSDISLEESFKLYEEGLKMINLCNSEIEGIETKVKKLNEDGSTEDFD